MEEDPERAGELRDQREIHSKLSELLLGGHKDADPQAIFLALERVLLGIVQDLGVQNGIGEIPLMLRDHPDIFPMFPTVPQEVPSTEDHRRCKAILRSFICEMRELGHNDSAIFAAFMNMYMFVGSQAVGALELAHRIEDWDPEHRAKLREAGLRSSYELDDEEGRVFVAFSAQHSFGVLGRRNAAGELFVSRPIVRPAGDFVAAVKQRSPGVELVAGPEADELLRKLAQVKKTS
jgi:hypothetical protein